MTCAYLSLIFTHIADYVWYCSYTKNIGTEGVQELFFYEVSEIGAFMELFTVMIWLSFWLRCTTREKLGIYDIHGKIISKP